MNDKTLPGRRVIDCKDSATLEDDLNLLYPAYKIVAVIPPAQHAPSGRPEMYHSRIVLELDPDFPTLHAERLEVEADQTLSDAWESAIKDKYQRARENGALLQAGAGQGGGS